MRYKNVIILLFIILSIAYISYFSVFNNGLSRNSEQWAFFATYINGLTVPIFTAINIIVFIRLTQTIDKNDKHHKERELRHQRAIILAQMQSKELDKLSAFLNNALNFNTSAFEAEITRPLHEALVYVESFAKNKQHLFPILRDKNVELLICDVHKQMINLSQIFKEFYTIQKDSTVLPMLPKDMIERTVKFLNAKNELISKLESYLIDSMGKA